MAQTKRKRRRKHRGTQGGRIDTRPRRGRPQSRSEAQARARSRGKKKPGERVPRPPSWGSAFKKGAIGALLFLVLLSIFGKSPLASLVAAVLLGLAFYVPMAYLMDRFFYRRHLRKEAEKRAERESRRAGAHQAEG